MGSRSSAVVAAGLEGLKAVGLVSRNQGLDVKSCNPVRRWPLRGRNDARTGHGDQPDGSFNVVEQALAVNLTGRTAWSCDPCFEQTLRANGEALQKNLDREDGVVLRSLASCSSASAKRGFSQKGLQNEAHGMD